MTERPSDPGQDSDFQRWLAERHQQTGAPVSAWPREPEPELEPPHPAYATGPVAHQAVSGGDSDQPVQLDETEVYPARAGHPVHQAGGHATGIAVSN